MERTRKFVSRFQLYRLPCTLGTIDFADRGIAMRMADGEASATNCYCLDEEQRTTWKGQSENALSPVNSSYLTIPRKIFNTLEI